MRRLAPLVVLLVLGALVPVALTTQASAAAGCHRTWPAYPVLRPGADRPEVRTLQCLLDDAGLGPVAVDGRYGPATRRAVRRLERGFEGPAPHPGRVDAGYWVLLLSRALPDRTLRLGDHGRAVRVLQRALRAAGATVVVDAEFGPRTRRGVRQLQRSQHLRQTGVVGQRTRFLLRMGATI